MLLLVGFISILFLSFSFIASIAQAKMKFRTRCYQSAIRLQKKIVFAEKALFLMNPKSTLLSLRKKQAYVKLATLSGPAAAAVMAEILKIHAEQIQLQKMQNTLIKATEILIQTESQIIESELRSEAGRHRQIWSHFLDLLFVIERPNIPKMSVQALSGDIAPNYGLKLRYKEEQAVVYNWHLRIFTKKEAQNYLIIEENRALRYEQTCLATIDKSGEKWSIEIAKDKF